MQAKLIKATNKDSTPDIVRSNLMLFCTEAREVFSGKSLSHASLSEYLPSSQAMASS